MIIKLKNLIFVYFFILFHGTIPIGTKERFLESLLFGKKNSRTSNEAQENVFNDILYLMRDIRNF